MRCDALGAERPLETTSETVILPPPASGNTAVQKRARKCPLARRSHDIGRQLQKGSKRKYMIKDPFKSKTRATKFEAGVLIPKPTGESWRDALVKHGLESDSKNIEAINSRLAEASYAEQYFLQWWKQTGE